MEVGRWWELEIVGLRWQSHSVERQAVTDVVSGHEHHQPPGLIVASHCGRASKSIVRPGPRSARAARHRRRNKVNGPGRSPSDARPSQQLPAHLHCYARLHAYYPHTDQASLPEQFLVEIFFLCFLAWCAFRGPRLLHCRAEGAFRGGGSDPGFPVWPRRCSRRSASACHQLEASVKPRPGSGGVDARLQR